MHHSNQTELDIVILDGEVAYVNINGYTLKNLLCDPKSLLEVEKVEVHKALIPVGVKYACAD